MSERDLRIAVGERGNVTAIEHVPGKPGGITMLYAPGSGSNVHDPFGAFLCRHLAERGTRAVRFQFLYQEAGKKSPDRPAILEETWRALIAHFAGGKLIVGGRSMGGRIGSQVVAGGGSVAGLALFAYPLHPPGKPERIRAEHLSAIAVPTLFCSGTADAFGSPDELREAAALVPRSSLHLMEHADHGFNVRKSSGRTREDIFTEAVEAFWSWLQSAV